MRLKWRMETCWPLALVALLLAATPIQAEDARETDIEIAWDSRYVTEGRDNLAGKGIAGATVEAAFRFLTVGAWFGANPQSAVRYRELNGWLALEGAWGAFEGYVSYKHLRLLSDREHDNEMGVGLAYTALPLGLALGVEGYYSFDAGGSFYELVLGGEYQVLDWLMLAPSATMGINAGYIEDGHDGANHIALGLEATYPLAESVHAVGGITHSWKIDADPAHYPGDETLDDYWYGRLALGMTF